MATRNVAEETRPLYRFLRKPTFATKCNSKAVTYGKDELSARKPERQRGKLDLMSIYDRRNDEEKNITKCILPALMVSGIVFAVMKYKENSAEPVMTGNYFDSI